MKFVELAKKRMSTREYASRPVTRELIDQCLEAARMAPSACNSQPWSFIVIDDSEVINKIATTAMSGIYSSNSFVKSAPVLIAAITENSKYIARLGGMLRDVKYNLIDIGVACDHLVLQAEDLGLNSCWLGWFKEKAVKKVLNLPQSVKVDIMISLGYASRPTNRKKIRKPLNKIRVYYQKIKS